MSTFLYAAGSNYWLYRGTVFIKHELCRVSIALMFVHVLRYPYDNFIRDRNSESNVNQVIWADRLYERELLMSTEYKCTMIYDILQYWASMSSNKCISPITFEPFQCTVIRRRWLWIEGLSRKFQLSADSIILTSFVLTFQFFIPVKIQIKEMFMDFTTKLLALITILYFVHYCRGTVSNFCFSY